MARLTSKQQLMPADDAAYSSAPQLVDNHGGSKLRQCWICKRKLLTTGGTVSMQMHAGCTEILIPGRYTEHAAEGAPAHGITAVSMYHTKGMPHVGISKDSTSSSWPNVRQQLHTAPFPSRFYENTAP